MGPEIAHTKRHLDRFIRSAGLTMGVRAVWDAMTRNVVTGGSRTVHANPLQLK